MPSGNRRLRTQNREPVSAKKPKKFVRYSLIWYSEQFAIPFWVIGHVHLHLTNYHHLVELVGSITLNALVALGFWLGWRDYDKERDDEPTA